MLPRSLFSLLLASVIAAQTSSQYIDLFQGLQTFFQPYQLNKNYQYVTTRRPETRKHVSRHKNVNPTIVFPTDDGDKPRTTGTKLRTTTSKPSRKSRPNSSHSPTTRRPSKQSANLQIPNTTPGNKLKNENRRTIDLGVFNDNIYFADDKAKERGSKNGNRNPDVSSTVNKKNQNAFTTNWSNKNSYTTRNPLLNRPGVKPAPVDESRPPITNRPVENGLGIYPDTPAAYTEAPDGPVLEVGPDEDDMTSLEKRQYMDIAEQMCDEYKALSVKKVVALPLVPSSQGVEFNVSSCTPINIPLIIGGTVSRIEEFPHMSLVGWKKVQSNGYSWKCGGSLISDVYVLTAGHCTYHEKDYNVVSGPPHAVQLGSTYVDGPGAVVVKTSRVIRHPKYKQRRSYYDVALIKLASRVRFSEVVRPACLGNPPPVGQPIIATGWGRTEFGGDQSLELRSVSLPIWDMQDCRQIWGTSLKLPNGPSSESHVCAGEKSGGRDTCQGDSGGPAQIQDGCVWRVVAVTSSGRSCGAPDTPALYATVPKAFVAAQVFGKRAVDNRYNNQINGNQNQDNRNSNQNTYQQNNRNDNNVNSQNTWNQNQNTNHHNQNDKNTNHNSYQQNNRGTGNQNSWNTNQNANNHNQNGYIQQTTSNSYNNQNDRNTENNYNHNSNIYYHNNRDTHLHTTNRNNQNSFSQENNYNQNNRGTNQPTTNRNTNGYSQQNNYNHNINNYNQNNREVYQSSTSNRNANQNSQENNYNPYQNNRNSYVTESWNNPGYNPISDYNIGYVTERPW